jgi:Flp pilus assembly pilin Flp
MNDIACHRDERGATAVEYGLMLALICGMLILTVGLFGDAVVGLFAEIPPRLGRN